MFYRLYHCMDASVRLFVRIAGHAGTNTRSKRFVLFLSLLSLACVAVAQQAATMRLKINGTAAADAPITVKGKTYVSLDALKAAGVRVSRSGSTVALTLPVNGSVIARGGANQQDGVEGKMGEWLFNGIWRFRVLSVEKADPAKEGAGWLARVEIRNGSKFSGYSPGGTGWQGMSLVTEDGQSVQAGSNALPLSDPGLAQGASNAQSIYFATESASKPDRLILRFDPRGLEGTPAGLRFSVPNPTFRVALKNDVPGA